MESERDCLVQCHSRGIPINIYVTLVKVLIFQINVFVAIYSDGRKPHAFKVHSH